MLPAVASTTVSSSRVGAPSATACIHSSSETRGLRPLVVGSALAQAYGLGASGDGPPRRQEFDSPLGLQLPQASSSPGTSSKIRSGQSSRSRAIVLRSASVTGTTVVAPKAGVSEPCSPLVALRGEILDQQGIGRCKDGGSGQLPRVQVARQQAGALGLVAVALSGTHDGKATHPPCPVEGAGTGSAPLAVGSHGGAATPGHRSLGRRPDP